MAKLWSSKPTSWVRFPPLLYLKCFFMLKLNIFDKFVRYFVFFYYLCYFGVDKRFFKQYELTHLNVHLKSRQYFVFLFNSMSVGDIFNKSFLILLAYYYNYKRQNASNAMFFFKKYYNRAKVSKNLGFFYASASSIFKFFSLSLILAFLFIYVLSLYHITPFLKLIFGWLALFFFIYLLVSGFVYFVKKLTFSKYTDALQRFWKRTFSLFWLIEGGLFVVFIYFTLNASSEVFYGYDSQSFVKLHLGSLRLFFFKLCLINVILVLTNYLLVVCQTNNEDTIFSLYLLISIIIAYVTWLEFYQFYIYLQSAGYYSWFFSLDSYEFSLDPEIKRSRITNNFVLICAIAKFWHFFFIVFVWFFYLTRYLESQTARVTLISTSIQNFLILYILNLISLYPYIKFLSRRYLSVTYKWFFNEFSYSNYKLAGSFIVNFYSNLI
jgi:hypothetical protein